eukprot:6179277-Pleurochrysis_carterae.AAC.1
MRRPRKHAHGRSERTRACTTSSARTPTDRAGAHTRTRQHTHRGAHAVHSSVWKQKVESMRRARRSTSPSRIGAVSWADETALGSERRR